MKKRFLHHFGTVLARREFWVGEGGEAVVSVVADAHRYLREFCLPLRGDGNDGNWLVGGSFLKFRLFCDGVQIGAGPFRALRDGDLVEHSFAVSELAPGKHVLAVIFRGEQCGLSISAPQWGIETDEQWQIFDANSVYRPICYETPNIAGYFKGDPGPGEYFEHLDGRIYPDGWMIPGFNAANWQKPTLRDFDCRIEKVDWNYQLYAKTPVSVRKTGKDRYLLDFGREMIGSFSLSGPASGGAVEIHLGEELLDQDHVRSQMRTGNCYQEMWQFAPGGQCLSHFGLRIFRYAEVIGYTGEWNGAWQQVIHAPFQADDSRLESGLPELDRIWQLCKDTIEATNMDLYSDCFSRERICYEADSFVTMRSDFAVSGFTGVARRSVEYLIDHPTWPCEWKQMVLPLVDRYLMHTGDLDLLRRNWDKLEENYSFHRLIHHGMIETFPLETIVDWPIEERDGYDMAAPATAVANALAFYDLAILAKWAPEVGVDPAPYLKWGEEMKTSFNNTLFDPEKALYRDGRNSNHTSLHANLWALWCGLVPANRIPRVIDFIASQGLCCSIYTAQYLLDVLFRHGKSDLALQYLLAKSPRSWLAMLQNGLTLTSEYWTPTNSLAHPWSSSPANLIVEHLFGLKPTSPGWKTYQANPLPQFKHARLTITTPNGKISVGD